MSDITDESNQGKGFSVIALMWGAGLMVGPIVGGLLSQPADKYEALFSQDGPFGVFPFLLPCIFIASVSVVGLVVGIKYLKEPGRLESQHEKTVRASGQDKDIEMQGLGASDSLAMDLEAGDDDDDAESGSSTRVPTPNDCEVVDLEQSKTATESGSSRMLSNGNSSHSKSSETGSCTPTVLVTVLSYCVLKMSTIMSDEAFPLWAASTISEGGLEFDSNRITVPLTASGVALVLFQLFVFHRLEHCFGALQIFRIGLFVTAPLFAVVPFLGFVYTQAPKEVFW
eukprot:CAMPEP_0114558286 /NCGR_PEP_ID=MMETSP0114-20121206/10292_1 /TAXON_ID=31324 /ORGANISM="Goniomonas sp, Strain m" /LENGTH=283 /DNA_ID=CAMNT_0001743649 /DNA_START=358 /DNA_END=1206 /DNA_ORIENTATION=-